jgi:hypothetical protein
MHQDLDQLYIDWMDAESREMSALVMLGVRDCLEYRAAAEAASEKRAAAEAAYQEALTASGSPASTSSTVLTNSR